MNAMDMIPLHKLFGAEIAGGVDLTVPLTDTQVADLRSLFDAHGVTVIRHETPLTDEQHIAFSRRFGPLQRMKMLNMFDKSGPRLRYPELVDVGNLDSDGRILPDNDRRRQFNQGNLLWHADVSFDAVRATYSMLSAHVVPPGGADTEYCDLRAAYDALPANMQKSIDGLVAEHSIWHSRALGGLTEVSEAEKATRPPAQHALVHLHPGCGRKSLYLASHASHIVGWPVDEGRALLDELIGFATQQRFVYRHHWRVGDLVIWDNQSTMHRGTPFDDTAHARDMRRTTVLEAA